MRMKLGRVPDLQEALGGVGKTYALALKKAAGYQTRLFDIHGAVRWLRKNPTFTSKPRKQPSPRPLQHPSCPPVAAASTARASGCLND
jgi:hypothetical protein